MKNLPGKKIKQGNKTEVISCASAPAVSVDREPSDNDGSLCLEEMARALSTIREHCRELMAKYQDALPEEGKNYLLKIQRAASIQGHHRTTLTESIPDRSQRSGAIENNELIKKVDLGEMSKAIVAGLMLTKPERRIKFISAISVVAQGNERLLRIALRNLLNNAWRNTSQNEETIIELGVAECEGKTAYFIRDNGFGSDPAEVEEMLRSSEGDDGINVNAFGLDTAARIIRLHGGKIWVEVRADGCSVFYFTI